MEFFDFFKNMFKKQNCTFGGKECGMLAETKSKTMMDDAQTGGLEKYTRVANEA